MRRSSFVTFVALLSLATASLGQIVPFVGRGDFAVTVPVQIEKSAPVLSMGASFVGVNFSPFTGNAPVMYAKNLTTTSFPGMKTIIALHLSNVVWRDRGIDFRGKRIYAQVAIQRVGADGIRSAYAPLQAQLIDDARELNKKQPSGILNIVLPDDGRPYPVGVYEITVELYFEKVTRYKPLGDIPFFGPATTSIARGEAMAHMSLTYVVMQVVGRQPSSDADLYAMAPRMGMNPMGVEVPGQQVDQSAQFAEVVRQLQAQIAGLEQKLNAATVRPDLPEFRSTVPLKPNGGEAEPRRGRGAKPVGDDGSVGDAHTADAGEVAPPPDTSTAESTGSNNEDTAVPEKPRMRKVIVTFEFRDESGNVVRSQQGELLFTLSKVQPELRRPTGAAATSVVTGGARFVVEVPQDGKPYWVHFGAKRADRTNWGWGYVKIDPDSTREQVFYTCRR